MIEIKNKKDCCGCEACRQICQRKCITMQEDEEGFLYPSVDVSLCSGCTLCEKVCPILDNNSLGSETRKVFAAKNRNEQIQFQSASGGAFTPLVEWILSKDGVVFGACYNDIFEVIHSKAETTQEALKFRSSKYVQSRIGDTYSQIKELLIQGRYVLFSGTPCQVAGLKVFLRNDYEKLFCTDIVCHGVPSPKVFKDYIKYLQNKNALVAINMRSKEQCDWIHYSTKLTFERGKTVVEPMNKNIWMRLFLQNYTLRPACHSCKYTNFRRQGDISLADFWGIERKQPAYYDPNGVSLLLVNTQKGEKILEKIKNNYSLLESSREECLQSVLIEPCKQALQRTEFWRDYARYRSFAKIARKYSEQGILNRIIRRIFSS